MFYNFPTKADENVRQKLWNSGGLLQFDQWSWIPGFLGTPTLIKPYWETFKRGQFHLDWFRIRHGFFGTEEKFLGKNMVLYPIRNTVWPAKCSPTIPILEKEQNPLTVLENQWGQWYQAVLHCCFPHFFPSLRCLPMNFNTLCATIINTHHFYTCRPPPCTLTNNAKDEKPFSSAMSRKKNAFVSLTEIAEIFEVLCIFWWFMAFERLSESHNFPLNQKAYEIMQKFLLLLSAMPNGFSSQSTDWLADWFNILTIY